MSKELQIALDGLRRERTEAQHRVTVLDEEITNIERALTRLHPEAAATLVSQEPKEFTGALLRDAVKTLLERATAPMTTRQLCDALLAGGFRTTATDFYMVVYAGLRGWDNFARVKSGAWVYKEGAPARSYVDEKGKLVPQTKSKARAKGAER